MARPGVAIAHHEPRAPATGMYDHDLITTTFIARPSLASPIRLAHLGVHDR